MKNIFTLSIIILSLFSCEKPDLPEDTPDFDRKSLLTSLADGVIIPRYSDYEIRINTLYSSVGNFTDSPSISLLTECRENWRAALLAWQHVSPFEFGPAASQFTEAGTNIYPVDAIQIENNIELGSYDLNTAANSDARGFQAIDYLLFGAEDEQEIIDLFSTNTHYSSRKQYLKNIAEDLKIKANNLVQNWTQGNYRQEFIDNDGTHAGSSLGMLLNALNKSLESQIRANKIGIPSGAMTLSGIPNPNLVEAYFENNNSVSYLRQSVEAMENIYLGKTADGIDGIGLDDYLNALDAQYNGGSLDSAIKNQFQNIKNSTDTNLQEPLSEFVETNQSECLEVYAELQQLVVFFKVDMMSALGVLITYTDNDGD